MGQFRKVVEINLLGSFRCASVSAAGMLTLDPLEDGERGVIVHTACAAATDGQVGQVAYAASKGGILAMTLPMARDLMNEGVRVNTIQPGIFDTPLMMGAPQAVRDALAATVPFPKRFGTPKEFGRAVVDMCENGYINAATLRLDGGIRMPPR